MREYGFLVTRILLHKDRIRMRTHILTYFTQCLVKTGEFVFKNNYFELNSNWRHQKSGTGILYSPTICMYIHGLHGYSVSQK